MKATLSILAVLALLCCAQAQRGRGRGRDRTGNTDGENNQSSNGNGGVGGGNNGKRGNGNRGNGNVDGGDENVDGGNGRGRPDPTDGPVRRGPNEGSKGKGPPNKPFGPNDWNNGRKMKDKPGKGKEGGPGKFELDIALGEHDLEFYKKTFPFSDASSDVARDPAADGPQANARIGSNFRWSGATIPYYISPDFNDYERSRIANAIEEYHSKTCIRFVPGNGEYDYVYFIKGNGCWSYVGRQGGGQDVSIGSGCAYTGIVQHELMHAVGFFHEQSRPDRDSYVQINWGNIQSGMESNFQRYSLDRVDTMGTYYDYGSVMHYGAYYFSANGQATIVTFNGAAIGQRDGLSTNDVYKLNRMYNCGSTCVDQYPATCPYYIRWCSYVKDYCCATCS